MDTIKLNPKRMSVQIQRLLMMMVAIIVASMTITACLEDENSEENNEENGGNGGGGVSGKRIKTMVQTTGPIDGAYKTEWSYNSDGTIKRTDHYDEQSKLLFYQIHTYNSNGTLAKLEANDYTNAKILLYNYSYDSNKKPTKMQGVYYYPDGSEIPATIDYTFQNGRKIREVFKMQNIEDLLEYNYDSNGRITTVTETHNIVGTRQKTYTYSSDGTLQKVTYPNGYGGSDNRIITREFTWENGKTTQDIMDVLRF